VSTPDEVQTPEILTELESYYDTAPRAGATTVDVGPFTLFLKTDPDGWEYYGRPRLGLDEPVTAGDVDLLRARQRALRVPEGIEWVHQTTPSLRDAVLASGLAVTDCPLLVLAAPVESAATGFEVRMLTADDALAPVLAAVDAAFNGTDAVRPRATTRQERLLRDGLLATAGAYDGRGTAVGGGSHGPRGTVTELTGIGVLPRARRRGVGAALTAELVRDAHARGMRTVFLSAQDDAVARIYERVGFVRVGTACIAEPARG
jgi:ribosomal protein S18 acetylase RimI-like enzyme